MHNPSFHLSEMVSNGSMPTRKHGRRNSSSSRNHRLLFRFQAALHCNGWHSAALVNHKSQPESVPTAGR